MQGHCKRCKKEVRESRFWRKATPFVVVIVVAVLMVVSVNAAFPPTLSGENGGLLGATALDGKVNSLEQQGGSIRYLTYYQMYCGCFGSYVPVMVFYDSGLVCNVLGVRADSSFTVEYDPVGDIWGVTASLPMVRWRLTDRGFTEVNSAGLTDVTRSDSDVLYIWTSNATDLPGLNLIYNEGYVSGTATAPALITATWRSFWEKAYYYEEDVTEAESKGYHEGYETGFYQGNREGYQEGLNVGYDAGYLDGDEAGYLRGYETGFADGYESGLADGGDTPIGPEPPSYDDGFADGYETGFADGYETGFADGYTDGELNVSYAMVDVGSVITSIPLGAKQIFEGALGFEIFGINVAGTLTAILVVAIVAFVVKWLIGRK